jgi:hypothetical protein
VQDGRIFIEKINWPFLTEYKGSVAEHNASLKLTIERGWLWDAPERDRCEDHGSLRHAFCLTSNFANQI